MKRRIVLLVFALSCTTTVLHGQQVLPSDTALLALSNRERSVAPDSVEKRPGFFRRVINYFADSNEDKTLTRRFDFSIIGGPHYSSDTGFGIGVVAAGLFRADRRDLTIPPSNVSFYGDISTSGFYMLGIRGNTLFQGARYRLDYNVYFFSMPSDFWGIGYESGRYNERSTYRRLQTQTRVDFMFRIARNTYLGLNASLNYIAGKNFSRPAYLEGERHDYLNIGNGLFFLYDSRDYISNASRGIYFKLDQRSFPRAFGNRSAFSRTEVTADFYHPLWKGATLAWDLHALLNWGDTPWTMLAMMGGSYRMRGYYEGRYRDKGLVEAQVELRQKIYGRSGIAVWVGAGNVFPTFSRFNWGHTLPNYGIGYRWEFKNRVNVRLDLGFGKGQSGFIFNINEAF